MLFDPSGVIKNYPSPEAIVEVGMREEHWALRWHGRVTLHRQAHAPQERLVDPDGLHASARPFA